MPSYLPISGRLGFVRVNGTTLSVDHFDQDITSNIIAAPSFTGSPYVEHTSGLKSTRITISGTWNGLFNLNSTLKVGLQYTVILGITGTVESGDDDAWLESLHVSDDADGKAEFTMSFVGDWIFTDFSGGDA